MIGATAAAVHRLSSGAFKSSALLDWGCPVPYFGDVRQARVATLGINPSNREFVDEGGQELQGDQRRFPTLRSLRIDSWDEASSADLDRIVDACDGYFSGNPYDRWFRVLDAVLLETGASYYSKTQPAAHLDLVPYATSVKWGVLPGTARRNLLDAGTDLLARLLLETEISLLVLNGRSVVREFERSTGVELVGSRCHGWDLPRGAKAVVPGLAYVGTVDHLRGIQLDCPVSVVGFNHNLQSSFGVTRGAVHAIAQWIGEQVPR